MSARVSLTGSSTFDWSGCNIWMAKACPITSFDQLEALHDSVILSAFVTLQRKTMFKKPVVSVQVPGQCCTSF